jgi:hypothetical protein
MQLYAHLSQVASSLPLGNLTHWSTVNHSFKVIPVILILEAKSNDYNANRLVFRRSHAGGSLA